MKAPSNNEHFYRVMADTEQKARDNGMTSTCMRPPCHWNAILFYDILLLYDVIGS